MRHYTALQEKKNHLHCMKINEIGGTADNFGSAITKSVLTIYYMISPQEQAILFFFEVHSDGKYK